MTEICYRIQIWALILCFKTSFSAIYLKEDCWIFSGNFSKLPRKITFKREGSITYTTKFTNHSIFPF